MSQALKNIEVEKVVIEGYEQPSKITLPKIDVARAKAVRNLCVMKVITTLYLLKEWVRQNQGIVIHHG